MNLLPSIPSIGKMNGQIGRSIDDIDPDAAATIAALTALGASVTPIRRDAINAWYIAGKAQGWGALVRDFRAFWWELDAANALDWVSKTSGTWVGGITRRTRGVSSDGSTGYFNTGRNPSAMGCTLNSTSFGFIGLRNDNTPGVLGGFLSRTQDSNNGSRIGITNFSTILAFQANNATSVDIVTPDQRGALLTTRRNSSAISAYLRTGGGFSTLANQSSSSSGSINSTIPIAIMALNNNGAITVNTPNNSIYGASYMLMGLTDQQAEDFLDATVALWGACTGSTLPTI